MRKLIVIGALLTVGCSDPPSKEPNASPNNTTNVVPNNGTVPTNAQNMGLPTVVDPNDFDQSCELDADCELVWGGDVCGCGEICGDAIATSAVDEFVAAQQAITCSPNGDPQPCSGAACQAQLAVCSSGNCEAIVAVSVEASQFDQSCEIDDECVLIRTGQICVACDCSRGSINQNDFEAYLAATGEPDCNPGPSPCDCIAPDQAFCNAGTCDVRFAD